VTALPVYYNPPSSYAEQDLPLIESHHAVAVDFSQSGPPSDCATSYGIADLIYPSSATTPATPSATTSIPARAPCPIIGQNQGESGHDHTLQGAITRSAGYKVSTHQHPGGKDVDLETRSRESIRQTWAIGCMGSHMPLQRCRSPTMPHHPQKKKNKRHT
jgi:hypothetical protein